MTHCVVRCFFTLGSCQSRCFILPLFIALMQPEQKTEQIKTLQGSDQSDTFYFSCFDDMKELTILLRKWPNHNKDQHSLANNERKRKKANKNRKGAEQTTDLRATFNILWRLSIHRTWEILGFSIVTSIFWNAFLEVTLMWWTRIL